MTPWSRVRIAVVMLAIFLGGCRGASDSPAVTDGVRVASFDFAESSLLAEMYAQLLDAADIPVVRLGSIGPREIVAPAMELDRIDLVPEYLGTALQYFGAPEPNPDTDSAVADLTARLEGRGLTPLEPSPAEDKNVVVVTVEIAGRDSLENISDLGSVADGFRFGGPAECRDRPLCLLGLNRVYGLSFAEFVPQRSLAFTAEALRRGEIEVGLMFSTAAPLESPDFVVLNDDLGLQPAENIIPVVRMTALERWGPGLSDVLDAMAPFLTTSELRSLNLQVSEGVVVDAVVRDWLVGNKLIRPPDD